MRKLIGCFCFLVLFSFSILGQNPESIPLDPGLYYQQKTGFLRVEGQAISFARTGSRLVSTATFGVKSAKINAQILGSRARLTVERTPVFYYRVPSANEALGGSAGDLLLVRMKVKGKRRQFEIGSAGQWRASSGISLRSQYPCARDQVASGLYRISASETLDRGEYGLYLFRGHDLPGFLYDFTVE